MRKLLFSLALTASIGYVFASEPVLPTRSIFGDYGRKDAEFVEPLSEIWLSFKNEIKLLPGAKAYVESDGRIVAEPSNIDILLANSACEHDLSVLSLCFDGRLLPKGKNYNLVVEPDAVADFINPSETNPRIEIPFSVPTSLGEATWSIKDGDTLSKAWSASVTWPRETPDRAGNEYMELRCDGILVNTYPVRSGWEWNLGQAHASFGREMHFLKGHEYTLTLPAGAVCSRDRDDIVNEETSVSFKGGWEDSTPEFTFRSIRVITDPEKNTLQAIHFIFNEPFVIGSCPKVQVWEGDEEKLVAESVPYLNTAINCYCLTAEFNDVPLVEWPDTRGNTFVIVEGSILSTDSYPAPNPRISSASGSAGVESVISTDSQDAVLYDMFGRAVDSPQPGTLYIRSGRKFIFR